MMGELEFNTESIAKEKGIFFAGEFSGPDSLSFCDDCGEDFMMSELTAFHSEDNSDRFVCGGCIMNSLNL